MDDLNPYSPPNSDPVAESRHRSEWPLASPGRRIAAAIWDWLVVLALMMIVLFAYGALAHRPGSSWHVSATGPSGVLLYYATWLIANWACLNQGQTLGKRLLKIKAVRTDGSPLEAVRYVSHRVLPFMMLWFVMNIGQVPLVILAGLIVLAANTIFLFSADRRCIHDLIADTKVVRLG